MKGLKSIPKFINFVLISLLNYWDYVIMKKFQKVFEWLKDTQSSSSP